MFSESSTVFFHIELILHLILFHHCLLLLANMGKVASVKPMQKSAMHLVKKKKKKPSKSTTEILERIKNEVVAGQRHSISLKVDGKSKKKKKAKKLEKNKSNGITSQEQLDSDGYLSDSSIIDDVICSSSDHKANNDMTTPMIDFDGDHKTVEQRLDEEFAVENDTEQPMEEEEQEKQENIANEEKDKERRDEERTRTIRVHNVSLNTKKQCILRLFKQYGSITSLR